MASSNGSSNDGDVLRDPAGNSDGVMQADSSHPAGDRCAEDAETLKNSGELLTKLESGLFALMNALVKGKFGEPLSGLMTNFLECSICKDIMIEAVFRNKCEHTFCCHCLIHWTRNSRDCPICREKGCLVFRNPLIDGVVNILVDLTFSEDEKKERINSVQQRAISFATVNDELLAFLQERMVIDPSSISADLSLVCRYLCIKKAWVFLCEALANGEVYKQIHTKEDERLADGDIYEMFESFLSDFQSLSRMTNGLALPWLSR